MHFVHLFLQGTEGELSFCTALYLPNKAKFGAVSNFYEGNSGSQVTSLTFRIRQSRCLCAIDNIIAERNCATSLALLIQSAQSGKPVNSGMNGASQFSVKPNAENMIGKRSETYLRTGHIKFINASLAARAEAWIPPEVSCEKPRGFVNTVSIYLCYFCG